MLVLIKAFLKCGRGGHAVVVEPRNQKAVRGCGEQGGSALSFSFSFSLSFPLSLFLTDPPAPSPSLSLSLHLSLSRSLCSSPFSLSLTHNLSFSLSICFGLSVSLTGAAHLGGPRGDMEFDEVIGRVRAQQVQLASCQGVPAQESVKCLFYVPSMAVACLVSLHLACQFCLTAKRAVSRASPSRDTGRAASPTYSLALHHSSSLRAAERRGHSWKHFDDFCLQKWLKPMPSSGLHCCV